ncbi:COG1361 S-layer family protein [Haloarcula amylovorans]|uniref:COG1361 S-layer family protein n=1 Tax=Haloarcula amylovorans TaxID=2562280 RepID=UPI00107601B0|nr:COG1361 S-layer family protein [Halomicroarcula amylolytica]
MNRRTPLTLTVVALLLAAGTAAAAVTGSPNIDATLADNTVSPGEETTLDVVLVNSGDVTTGSARNPSLSNEVTTARALKVDVQSGDAPINVVTSRQSIGTLTSGPPTTVSFAVSVDEDADPGRYRVPVELDYEYTSYISEEDGSRTDSEASETAYVTVRVSDDATFDVTNVNSSARVGSTGTVGVTVENTGESAARDAAVTLQSQNQDLGVGGGTASSRYVDEWESGESRTFQYSVSAAESAEPEPYQFNLSVGFDNENGVRKQSVGTSVGIAPDPQQTFSVVSTENDVSVDDTGSYSLTLRNEGPVTVSDSTVTVASQSSDITFGEASSTTQYVGEWEPGETRTVTVDATAGPNAENRNYALTTSVNYEDPEGDSGVEEGLSVGLQPGPEQDFSLSNVNATLQAGEDGQLEATLTNEGQQTVENVVLKWDSDHSNLSPQETQYAVGDLGAGESATVSFGVDASDSAEAGPRQFDFVAQYQGNSGDTKESGGLQVRANVAASQDEFVVESTNTTVSPGGSETIELTVTNNEDVTLSDISAKLFADSPISVTDDEAYVASLGPGNSTTIRFGISASGGAMEKAYPVSLDFQYTEPDGDSPVSDTYRVAVDVNSENDGGGFPLIGIAAVVLLVSVLAIGGYARYQ